MGRVSRILKAVSDKPKDIALSGLEKPPRTTARDSSAKSESIDLARLIACWPRMPKHFKQTILTLVEVTEAAK